MSKPITPEELAAARDMLKKDRKAGRGRLTKILGCSEHRARAVLLNLNAEEEDDGESRWDESNGEVFATVVHPQCTNIDELLEYFEVDRDIWQVDRHVVNQWGSGNMLQVKAWLKRRVTPVEEEVIRSLIERSVQPLPAKPAILEEPSLDGHMLVLSPVDHHFGKMAWGKETGDNYDLKIAEQLYVWAVEDALAQVGDRKLDEIHIPVGHDLYHFDSSRGTTASGTQMDVDSRPGKVFVSACFAVAAAIQRASEEAPVFVHFVPGNHDPTWSHHLCVFLWAFFKDVENVHVDFSPMGRKYVEYGTNLILMTHGDMSQQNIKNLPTQLAVMMPEAWGRTRHWEIHLGHFHNQKEMAFIPLQEQSGVMLRILPSLCGTDEWHFTKGFVGNKRAMVSLLYSKERGYTGQFISYARDMK